MQRTNDFVHIDENRLDWEWVRQAGLYHGLAVDLAEARNKHAEAKADLELTVAELDHKIRVRPDKYDLEKTTEAVIDNTIKRQKEYQHALKVMNNAKHECDLLQAGIDALEHKKKALENCVSLFLHNFHSEPRGKGESKQFGEELDKKATRKRGQRQWVKT